MKNFIKLLLEKFSKLELYCILKNIEAYTEFQYDVTLNQWNKAKDYAWEIDHWFSKTLYKTNEQRMEFLEKESLLPTENCKTRFIEMHGEEPWLYNKTPKVDDIILYLPSKKGKRGIYQIKRIKELPKNVTHGTLGWDVIATKWLKFEKRWDNPIALMLLAEEEPTPPNYKHLTSEEIEEKITNIK